MKQDSGFGKIFQQGMFQIDPNATPETLERKRNQIRQLMTGKTQYVGGGLAKLATGIVGGIKGRNMDKFEGEKTAEANDLFNSAIGGGYGGGQMTMTGFRPSEPTGTPFMPEEAAMGARNEALAQFGGPTNEAAIASEATGGGSPLQNRFDPDAAAYEAGPVGRSSGGAPLEATNMGGYRASLIGTESGGNWGAKNSETGAGGKKGHFGRVQFGQARLQEAMNAGAIPQGMSPQQFMANPQAQMSAENWHFGDLEKKLSPLVGAKVNGQTLDMGALVAMGHLGGAGGARKYVESGGRYNPSDSFGTSLSDYAQTHGGQGGGGGAGYTPSSGGYSTPQQQDMTHLYQALQNPWLNANQRQVITSMIGQGQQSNEFGMRQQAQQARDMQQRDWGREDDAYSTQQKQNDPMYQAQLAQAQLDLEQDRAGVSAPNAAFSGLDQQAQAAGLQPGTPEYQNFMLNGGGAPSTFRALDMQAQAAGLTPGTPEYNDFMATRGAGLQAGAKTRAENEADIATGGAAEGAKDLGKATIAAGTAAWEGYGKLQTSLGNIDEAISAIDSGAKSGLVYSMLPSVTQASASLENAMNRMGLDVIGSVTFGALSEGEMRLAMSTAVPQNLAPADLRNWLVRRRDAQAKTAEMLADAAQFLTVPGNTINGWIEKNRAGKPVAPPPPDPQAAAPQAGPSDDDLLKQYGGGN